MLPNNKEKNHNKIKNLLLKKLCKIYKPFYTEIRNSGLTGFPLKLSNYSLNRDHASQIPSSISVLIRGFGGNPLKSLFQISVKAIDNPV